MDPFTEAATESADGAPPPARRGLPAWAVLLVVAGVVALGVGATMVGSAAVVVPKAAQDQPRRAACMGKLLKLVHVFLAVRKEKGDAVPAHCGSALWLSFRDGPVRRGDEQTFVCLGDPLGRLARTPEELAVYEKIDLGHAPRSLCSYAGRDFENFPLDEADLRKEVIGVCIHHVDGAVVAYGEGVVKFVTTEELGVSAAEDKIVGPTSKSPILRMVRYGDGSVR